MLLPLRGGYGAQGVGQDATAKITQLPQMTLLPRPELFPEGLGGPSAHLANSPSGASDESEGVGRVRGAGLPSLRF